MSLPDTFFQPGFSLCGLSSLDLHHSTISLNGLGRILLATPCLKSLKYDSWIDVSMGPSKRRLSDKLVDCTGLGRELAHVNFTLEQLQISMHYFFTPEMQPPSETQFWAIRDRIRGISDKVAPLHEFTKLTSLTMPTYLVADWIRVWEYNRVEFLPLEIANFLPMNTLDHLLLLDNPSLYKVVQSQ